MEMPNPQAPPPKAGPFMKLLMKIAGVTEERLAQCPQEDWDNVRAIGEIQICVWLYQTGLFSLIGHRLFAAPGQIRPDIILLAAFLATMITAIDSYVIMRSGWHLEGLKALARGGLDIAGGALARVKAAIFLCVRIALSVGLAQLMAVFAGIIVYAADIGAKIQASDLMANAHLVGPATALVDASIKRTTDAVATQTKRVDDLGGQVTALRQVEIDPSAGNPEIQDAEREVARITAEKTSADNAVQAAETREANEFGGIKRPGTSGKPGYGLAWRAAAQETKNAKDHDLEVTKALTAARARLEALRSQAPATDDQARERAHGQLPGFETALAAETKKLTDLKAELATLTAGRDAAINSAIDNAPDHVAHDDGFLAQLKVLEDMAEQDHKILAVLLLVDFVSFGFELAAVLGKITSFLPSTYALMLAKDAYMRGVRTVDDMLEELDRRNLARGEPTGGEGEPPLGGTPQGGAGGMSNGTTNCPCGLLALPPPAKRKRGRPRKYPAPPFKGSNGSGNSEAA